MKKVINRGPDFERIANCKEKVVRMTYLADIKQTLVFANYPMRTQSGRCGNEPNQINNLDSLKGEELFW